MSLFYTHRHDRLYTHFLISTGTNYLGRIQCVHLFEHSFHLPASALEFERSLNVRLNLSTRHLQCGVERCSLFLLTFYRRVLIYTHRHDRLYTHLLISTGTNYLGRIQCVHLFEHSFHLPASALEFERSLNVRLNLSTRHLQCGVERCSLFL